jgi:hypothetical protein
VLGFLFRHVFHLLPVEHRRYADPADPATAVRTDGSAHTAVMDQHHVIDDAARAKLTALSALCIETLEASRQFGNRTRWYPEPDSPLENERTRMKRKRGPKEDWDDVPARGAAWVAAVMLPAAGQYLAGMSALLEKFEVIFPLAPVARSVFELAGRITWLLDPRIEARDRAARYLLIRIDDAIRSKTVAHALGELKQESAAGALLHTLRKQELPRRFFPSEIERTPGGDLIIRRQQLPGLHKSVRILDEVHGESWNAGGLYVFLSAASHPTMRMIFEMVDRREFLAAAAIPSDDPVATMDLNFRLPDMNYPVTLTRNALLTYVHTWQLVASYHGLEAPEAAELVGWIDQATS